MWCANKTNEQEAEEKNEMQEAKPMAKRLRDDDFHFLEVGTAFDEKETRMVANVAVCEVLRSAFRCRPLNKWVKCSGTI